MENKYNSFFFIKNKTRNQPLDFLREMNINIFQKTLQEMKLLAIYGIDTKNVSVKKFQNNIWKIRAKDPSNNVRLFFYIIDNNIYYLYGFMKNTQKTPEGKKITINNLKIDLLNSLKKKDFEQYLLPIDFENIRKH